MTDPSHAGSELYRAETRKIAAQITTADGTRYQGELYLQPNVLRPGGFESPLDLLNRPEPFFALARDGGVVFLSKAQTAVIECATSDTPPDAEPERLATVVELPVDLATGDSYRGSVAWELPPDRSRLSDFLNSSDPFLALAGDTLTWYLNRAYLRAVHQAA